MSGDQKCGACPLSGTKVLDLTRLIPGAVCSCILADAGADVIKVEEPRVGDYAREIKPLVGSMSSRFLILNRNKRSIALDLKKKEGKKAFLRLVKASDVIVEGFRPGTMGKLELGFDRIMRENPEIIFCSITSFGHDGPLRDLVAHDINILGLAGFFEIGGPERERPPILGVQLSDTIAGMNAAMAILIALLDRTGKGRGQFIDISMFDGMLSWMFDAVQYPFAKEKVPRKGEGRLWGGSFKNLYDRR